MAEGRDTNPFASDDNNPHLPPTVYQPNPYPYNPAEGNPWAPTSNQLYTPGQGHAYSNTSSTYSYGGHNYNNTSSDSGSSFPPYIPMPTPSVPTFNNTNNNSSYDTNAYNNNTYNNSSDYYNAYS